MMMMSYSITCGGKILGIKLTEQRQIRGGQEWGFRRRNVGLGEEGGGTCGSGPAV
jgi:hypothetical protein